MSPIRTALELMTGSLIRRGLAVVLVDPKSRASERTCGHPRCVPASLSSTYGNVRCIALWLETKETHSPILVLKEHRFQRELTFLAVILALLAFCTTPGQTVNMFSDDDATTTIANNLVSGVLGLAAAFAADVYITAALCFVLYGRRTGFQRLFQLAACISFGASVNTAVVPWALFIIPGNSGVPHLHDEEFGAANYSNHSLRQLADGYVRHPISHAMMPYSAQDISLNVRHHVADIVSNSQNNPRENMELHNVSAHGMHIAARIASLEAQKLSGNTTKIVFSKGVAVVVMAQKT
ncbi:hypothetical protein IEO21_08642 [Rhodonia placenta]|uniref:Uncharacterized protein n=1 Tax=Rhodonia placenta TaxID=104341 RepID=A0A8H7NWA3_9APHY|nr:hypothetical protein IEO21_08642 [Postia placenta]